MGYKVKILFTKDYFGDWTNPINYLSVGVLNKTIPFILEICYKYQQDSLQRFHLYFFSIPNISYTLNHNEFKLILVTSQPSLVFIHPNIIYFFIILNPLLTGRERDYLENNKNSGIRKYVDFYQNLCNSFS